MVLSKPNNQNVMKAFSLEGKVAAVTGESNKELITQATVLTCPQAVLEA